MHTRKCVTGPTKVDLEESKGWLWKFKKRNGFKSHLSHSESSSVNDGVTSDQMKRIRVELNNYAVNDIFNADERALYYRLPPTTTMGPEPLPGKKKEEHRVTVLVYTNGDGSERRPRLFTRNSNRPRCFSDKSRNRFMFMYRGNKRAWIKSEIFKD